MGKLNISCLCGGSLFSPWRNQKTKDSTLLEYVRDYGIENMSPVTEKGLQ